MFSFGSQWVVPCSVPRVHAVLADLEHYPDWWRQVLAVARVDDDTARVLCRSRLPYTLDLVLHAETRRPELLETRIAGDLAGTARWRLTPLGDATRVDFEQHVRVTGPLTSLLARPLAPLLRWNHDQMMAGCHAGLPRRAAATAGVSAQSAGR